MKIKNIEVDNVLFWGIISILLIVFWKQIKAFFVKTNETIDSFKDLNDINDIEFFSHLLYNIDTKLEFKLHQKRVLELLKSYSISELNQLNNEFEGQFKEWLTLKYYENLILREYIELIAGKKIKEKLLVELKRANL